MADGGTGREIYRLHRTGVKRRLEFDWNARRKSQFPGLELRGSLHGLERLRSERRQNDAHENPSWNVAKKVAVLQAVTVEASRRRL